MMEARLTELDGKWWKASEWNHMNINQCNHNHGQWDSRSQRAGLIQTIAGKGFEETPRLAVAVIDP